MSLTLVEISPTIILGKTSPNEESGVLNRAEGTNVRIKINNKGEAGLG